MKRPQEVVVRFGARLAAQRANGEFKAPEECIVVEELSLRLEEILADLGLSAYKLAVRVAGQEERPSRFLFGLELEDVTWHGPLDKHSNARISSEQLVALIEAKLFTHRDTLLAQAVRDGEWERVLSTDLPQDWIPRPAFNDLLAIAIRNGLDVPKAIEVFVALFKGGMHPVGLLDQVEAVVATQSEPVIRVHVGSMDGLEKAKLSKDVRDRLFFETGLVFPPLKVTLDERLSATEFRLWLNRLRTIVNNFDDGNLSDALAKLLRNHGPVFISATTIDSALGRLAEAFPMVVFNTVEAFGTVSVLKVLRSLVDEGVDIRDLRTILCAMLEANGTLSAHYERLAVVLPYEATFLPEVRSEEAGAETNGNVECIRAQLRDQICQASADSDRVLHLVRLPAKLETRLSRLNHDPLGEYETFEIFSAIARVVETGQVGTVLVASGRNRRQLWELIRYEFPHVPVLCEAEISPYVKSSNAGEVTAG